MPTYTLPQFNLLADIWLTDTAPDAFPAAFTNFPCQKYINRGVPTNWSVGVWANGVYFVELRFPLDEPFDPTLMHDWQLGYVLVPNSGSTFYRVHDWNIRHEGFDNAYACVSAHKCDETGFPLLPKSATQIAYAGNVLHQFLGEPPAP